jgi:hypothetical protein
LYLSFINACPAKISEIKISTGLEPKILTLSN